MRPLFRQGPKNLKQKPRVVRISNIRASKLSERVYTRRMTVGNASKCLLAQWMSCFLIW